MNKDYSFADFSLKLSDGTTKEDPNYTFSVRIIPPNDILNIKDILIRLEQAIRAYRQEVYEW